VKGVAADPITDHHQRVHDQHLAECFGRETLPIELTETDAGVAAPDPPAICRAGS
jgi:hypothetical protein